MPDARQDELARAAAALLRDGRTADIHAAIRAVAERAGAEARRIPIALVRQHAQGMELETLGGRGYRRRIADILERAEEFMTLLATLLAPVDGGEVRLALVGRAARGHVDADPVCRVRVDTDDDIGSIAGLLVAAGYEEPAFHTLDSRHGRLSQLVVEDGGVTLRLTRCPSALRVSMTNDLVTGQPVPSLSLEELRTTIRELRAEA